jgi:hypothetical protein
MDPNENLTEQLQIAREMTTDRDGGFTNQSESTLRLAELVIALDEWIRKGGFIPEAWDLKARRRW